MNRVEGWVRGPLMVAAAFFVLLGLSGCMSSFMTGKSQAQLSYDACSSWHNDNVGALPADWAFVSGVGMNSTKCFWVYDAASPEQAQAEALANCQKEYGEDCFVFSDSGEGLTQWARTISDNGGLDPGGTAFSINDAINGANAVVGGYNSGVSLRESLRRQRLQSSSPQTPEVTYDGTPTTSTQSCGRRYVGLMRQSACRNQGYIPDSSITSDEDPDPLANCYTPPC